MKRFLLFLTVLIFQSQFLLAQRYITEQFTDVSVEEGVVYGQNYTILSIPIIEHTSLQPLVMDVYTPDGDTEVDRPAVLILHTGNFLPPQFNGGCNGTNKDADVVELAKRLAKMGYVAFTPSYRLGWDPTNPDPTARVFTIINAAYRGAQDARTAVKYLKKSVAELGNPYNINPNKIAMWGFGTGAYVTYGAATLNDITDTWIPKFVTPAGPMIVEQINGDLDATAYTAAPANYPGIPEGDSLCTANHVGYDATFQLAVQLGGACGDTSWVTPGDVPLISAHVVTDPFAPCSNGIVNVPPPINLPVVEVFGGCSIIPLADERGLNNIFDATYLDDISDYVNSVNGGVNGFFPFYSNDTEQSDPWGFSYSAEPYGVDGSDCGTDQAAALLRMDSIVQYFAPRACYALNLGCDLTGIVSADNLQDIQVDLQVAPNPADDYILFQSGDATPMEKIQIFDLTGRHIRTDQNINDSQFNFKRNNLPSGVYLAKVHFEAGVMTKKIVMK